MRLLALLCGATCLFGSPATAQQSASDFVGTWELMSIERRSEAGDWVPATYPGSAQAVGILMYDDKGNMAVQLTTSPREVRLPDSMGFVNGYEAYYGRYEVDAGAGTVTHHRRNHLNQDLCCPSVVRYFQFSGDVLTLTIAPRQQGRLKWARVR